MKVVRIIRLVIALIFIALIAATKPEKVENGLYANREQNQKVKF